MTDAAERTSGDAIVQRITRLGRSLQARGIEISLAELIDAGHAAQLIDLGSRDEFRVALRATMIKDERHYEAFDAAFDRLFPARPAGATDRPTTDSPVEAFLAGELESLAGAMVADHAGLDGEERSEGHHLQRAYRGADLAHLMSEARKLDPSVSTEDLRARVDELKRLMAAEIRAHLGEPMGEPGVDNIEDIDFLNASRAELEQMRATVRPLARRLAARLARRRQALTSGRVNLRRTARKSLSTGGVPIDVALERPRAHRPELFVLCDISGSVAEFSLFTLTFMSALSSEIAKTRSFVFVDAVDEITDLLSSTEHAIEPWQIMRNTNVIGEDGHSDYGSVFRQFWDDVGERDLRPTASVLITGDARSNHRPPGDDHLREIARRCRRVYWLNPEPKDEWDTHDSEMETYSRSCTETFEVRTVRQLVSCVEQIV